MTARQVYNYALIELNKVHAPHLLLDDFNYFINKAVGQYVNKRYGQFEINQQVVDDLRVLRSSAVATPTLTADYPNLTDYANIYHIYLPDDYFHLLNCVVEYTVIKKSGCIKVGDRFTFGAKRLTADIWPVAIKNHYTRPRYDSPYYFLTANTTSNNYPTTDNIISLSKNKTIELEEVGDIRPDQTITINGITYIFKTTPTTDLEVKCAYGQTTEFTSLGYLFIKLRKSTDPLISKNEYIGDSIIKGSDLTFSHTCGSDLSVVTTETGADLVDKDDSVRYGNSSKVKLEIRYGADGTIYVPSKIYTDYLRVPKFIELTNDNIEDLEDSSQILEFPDHSCQEIVNELVKLLLENASDPRLQSNIPINQSINGNRQGK